MHLKKLSIAAAIAVTTTIGTVSLNPSGAAAVNFTGKIKVDFDENVGDTSKNPLDGGQELDNLWADYGLKMDAQKWDKKNKKYEKAELWLYNSNCIAPGEAESTNKFTEPCTGGDRDLATGKGKYKKNGKWYKYNSDPQEKVLIIQEHGGDPDDAVRGIITFDFTDELGVDFHEIGLLDLDEPEHPKFKFYFANGTESELLDSNDSEVDVTLLSTKWNGNPLKKDNSLRKYNFNFKDVKKLEVSLPGSGAVTHLKYTRVPEPTSALGLLVGAFGMVSFIKRKAS
ncbi:MAG: PEP-CTERM sorting domain-containing protein [Calothrix sp. MO_192.B10]|nr:PEP-CTERM sorting domain-containing protein [Calothrix sp. MO_192.B10]